MSGMYRFVYELNDWYTIFYTNQLQKTRALSQ